MIMKAAERHDNIERIVNLEGSITISSLKNYFPNISEMTLRRDLETMDHAKRIIRVHGGARSIESTVGMEDDYLLRNTLRKESKEQIAQKALALLRPNICVFIGSGTTTTELCRLIPQEHYLIYTNGLSCAMELKRLKKAEIHLLGGRLNAASLSIFGSAALEGIRNIHFDLTILGSTGFHPNFGFTTENSEDDGLKREALRRVERCAILMDSSKLGRVSTYTFAVPKDIDVLVSDDHLDEHTRQHFSKLGVNVL